MHSSVVWCLALLLAVVSGMSLSPESSAESEDYDLPPATHTSHRNDTHHATYTACLHEVCHSIIIVSALLTLFLLMCVLYSILSLSFSFFIYSLCLSVYVFFFFFSFFFFLSFIPCLSVFFLFFLFLFLLFSVCLSFCLSFCLLFVSFFFIPLFRQNLHLLLLPAKQKSRLNWNFNRMCKMVLVRARVFSFGIST